VLVYQTLSKIDPTSLLTSSWTAQFTRWYLLALAALKLTTIGTHPKPKSEYHTADNTSGSIMSSLAKDTKFPLKTNLSEKPFDLSPLLLRKQSNFAFRD